MISLNSYIVKAVKDSLAQDAVAPVQLEQEFPGAPVVAPTDAPVFPEETMRKLDAYKEKAQLIQDFEGFMALLDYITNEEHLLPADRTKLASLLNRFRFEAGEDPL